MWTKKQIELHTDAALLLDKIKNETFNLIQKNSKITERDVQKFIFQKIYDFNMVIDKSPIIVAFNSNSDNPHYAPIKTNRKIANGDIVMIDLWARLNIRQAPFADITWMGYYGKKMPVKMNKAFFDLLKSRDIALDYLRKNLKKGLIPPGRDIQKASYDYLIDCGYGEYLKHSLGHSIGFTSPHGRIGHLKKSNKNSLHPFVAYTIEPGIYIKGEFGIRSEIDFYFTDKNELVVSTPMQTDMVYLK